MSEDIMLAPGSKSEKSVPPTTTAETRGVTLIGQSSVNSNRAEQQQRDSSSPPYDVSSAHKCKTTCPPPQSKMKNTCVGASGTHISQAGVSIGQQAHHDPPPAGE